MEGIKEWKLTFRSHFFSRNNITLLGITRIDVPENGIS